MMSGLSKSILAFSDCKEALERAYESQKGAACSFPDNRAAKVFAQRCHQFRKLDRAENAKIYTEPVHSMHGRSVYDTISIRVVDSTVRMEKIAPGYLDIWDIE